MIGFLQQMGIFVLPLLALSVYAVGLILSKLGDWKGARPLAGPAASEVVDHALAGDFRGAIALAGPSHPVAQLLAYAHESAALRQMRAQNLLAPLEERLAYFPALANLATLAGLFGTVCGMIVSFLALRAGGGADPSALAGGIAQALVATALGLVTAIPSLGAHAVFQKYLLGLTSQLESVLAALGPSPAPGQLSATGEPQGG
ncbi:MAG: MotA/TolQ/ExbB proton channel family protein [Spirochaetales bacterium]